MFSESSSQLPGTPEWQTVWGPTDNLQSTTLACGTDQGCITWSWELQTRECTVRSISLGGELWRILNLKESREKLIKGECGFNEDSIFCSHNTCAWEAHERPWRKRRAKCPSEWGCGFSSNWRSTILSTDANSSKWDFWQKVTALTHQPPAQALSGGCKKKPQHFKVESYPQCPQSYPVLPAAQFLSTNP